MLERFPDSEFVYSPNNDCMMLKRFLFKGQLFEWSEDDEIWWGEDETFFLEVPYVAEPYVSK